jgi:hypothetical protein
MLVLLWFKCESQDGSVSTAAGYRLDGWGPIPDRDTIFIFSVVS